jgi:hypothetical protein
VLSSFATFDLRIVFDTEIFVVDARRASAAPLSQLPAQLADTLLPQQSQAHFLKRPFFNQV